MITDILRSISIIFFHYTQFARKLQYKGKDRRVPGLQFSQELLRFRLQFPATVQAAEQLPHTFTYIHWTIFLLTIHSFCGILAIIQEVLFMCQTISLQKMNRDDDR